jgi:formate hydrogenlyase subunit 3/multisubunit Na+/H+ antiporter MnhD subunit
VHFFNSNTDMRQMGGVYLYSWDIAVLIFGVAFNLAGLPYSAGFLGKEFLLFQVLKDDFLSFFIRGCWLVSFFFTPIYMFVLSFIVIFGPKKSTKLTYSSIWDFKFYTLMQLMLNSLKTEDYNFTKIVNVYVYRFQYTILTCRTTVYV